LSFKTSSDRFRRAVARAIGHQLETVGVHVELRSFEAGTFLSDIRKGNFQATLMKLPEPSEPDMLRWMFFSMNTPSELPERRDTIPGLQSLLEGEDKGCRLWAQREVLDSAWRVLDRLVGRPPPRDRANRTWYANPRFDCLVMRGWEELDRARRKPLYDEAQRLLAEDRPVINLWHEHNVVVRSERVRDFEILPNGRLTPLARCRLNN